MARKLSDPADDYITKWNSVVSERWTVGIWSTQCIIGADFYLYFCYIVSTSSRYYHIYIRNLPRGWADFASQLPEMNLSASSKSAIMSLMASIPTETCNNVRNLAMPLEIRSYPNQVGGDPSRELLFVGELLMCGTRRMDNKRLSIT